VSKGFKNIVKLLLEHHADPCVEYLSRSCLHEAIRLKYFSIAKMLLSAGANPIALDAHGNTPLHIAVQIGSMELVSHLMSVMLNMKNHAGLTPVDLIPPAAPDRDDIVQYLTISD